MAALPWDGDARAPALDLAAGESGRGEGKIKPDPRARHPGFCMLMATAEAAREVITHPLQPWPAQRMAFYTKWSPKYANR